MMDGGGTALIVALVCIWVAVFLGAVYGGVMMEDKGRRQLLFAAAGLWVVILIGGSWLLLPEEAPPALRREESAPEKKEQPTLPTGNVVLVIDETTLPKETENQPLAIESTENPAVSREKRQEFRRLGRHLRNIEQGLMSRLNPLTAEAQRIDQRFKARQISNYDALHQKSQIKIRQAEMIVAAMEEKLSALEGSRFLTAEEIGADVERIKKRRDSAQQKREEYQGVLRELAANAEVFRDL
ncbi:MAG: hypothetical protein ACTTH3_01815 [Schwartzia sp. (in: firmicutes)]